MATVSGSDNSLIEEPQGASRWTDCRRIASTSVLTVIVISTVVVLSTPLIPFFFKDSSSSRINNNDTLLLINISIENVSCREMFYLDQSTQQCLPQCRVWSPLSPTTATVINVLFYISMSIALMANSAVIILALLNRTLYLTYPTVLVFYQSIFHFGNVLVTGLQSVIPNDILCNSPNLIDNLSNASIFCEATGIVYFYTAMAIMVLWLFQCVTFFWGVIWPYSYSTAKSAGRLRYIHISSLLISSIIPLIIVLIVYIQQGYGVSISLTPPCSISSPETYFYSIMIFIDVITIIGIVLMILTFWKLSKISTRSFKQEPDVYHQWKAEMKIVILILYISLLNVYNITVTNITISVVDEVAIGDYFLCEAAGEATECPRDALQEYENYAIAHFVTFILIDFYPCVMLLPFLDVCKLMCRSKRSRNKSLKTRSIRTST